MKRIRHLDLVLSLFMLYTTVSTAQTIEGVVWDPESREPIAFVHVLINGDPHRGLSSGIDGRFSIPADSGIQTLTLRCVGFKPRQVQLTERPRKGVWRIAMERDRITLDGVEVFPGENPAHRIIRRAVANRKKHDPSRAKGYVCETYNRNIFDFLHSSRGWDQQDGGVRDTILQGSYLFLMESVTERKFMAPDRIEDKVTATQVSGFKRPDFAPLATDLQPFGFYDTYIPLLDESFLNPIGPGSTSQYLFLIQDTLYPGPGDTTFVIHFQPRRGKNFVGLRGTLFIHSDGYAIEKVRAEPFEPLKIRLRILQAYQQVQGRWFPRALNFDMALPQFGTDSLDLLVRGTSEIRKVLFTDTLRPATFSPLSSYLAKDAAGKDSATWEQLRGRPLEREEQTTYVFMDSISSAVVSFDRLFAVSSRIGMGKIPLGCVELDVVPLFIANRYEGWRPGLGIQTGKRFSDRWRLRAFGGYGLRDRRWKYGGAVRFLASKQRDAFIELSAERNLLESGLVADRRYRTTLLDLRDYMADRFDAVERQMLRAGMYVHRHVRGEIRVQQLSYRPTYSYRQAGEVTARKPVYTVESYGLQLRWAPGVRRVESLGQTLVTQTGNPVFDLNFQQAIPTVNNRGLVFEKAEASGTWSHRWRKLGKSTLRVEAGMVRGRDLPAPVLFYGKAAFEKDQRFIIARHFQTMRLYEFLSDRYVHLFFKHELGTLLLNAKNFKPRVFLHHNMAWGDIDNPGDHNGLVFARMHRGYMESGLHVDQIVRFNYFNVGYGGLGAGVFYRHGTYALDNPADNWAFKVSFTFSIR